MTAADRANAVILTTGLSGSSVVTALLATQGYWLGRNTVFKSTAHDRYDTYENARLVRLNERLFSAVGGLEDYAQRFDPRWPALFDELCERVDVGPYTRVRRRL